VTAPTSPLRTRGNTHARNISQRVAPIASAAFLSSCETVASTSRLIAVTIGIIITARISPAVIRLAPLGAPPKTRSSTAPGSAHSSS
jgi:hypothetical protein